MNLVTGASGFVGGNVARALLSRGESVRVLLRPKADQKALKGLRVDIAYGNLLDPDSLRLALSGCRRLFHAAAHYSLWSRDAESMYRSNVEGTKNILAEALRQNIERVVYTSSVGVLGNRGDGTPASEETPVALSDMTGAYKCSKFLAEEQARDFFKRGLPVVIVNPSAPMGPWDVKPTPTGRIVLDFINRKLPCYLETGLNVVDVEDVAEGHLLACEKGRPGERYILGSENLLFSEIMKLLEDISGVPAPIFRVPYPLALFGAYISEGLSLLTHHPPRAPLAAVRMAKKKMFFDSSKAKRELGYSPKPARVALEKAVRWFSDHGYIH